MTLTETAFETLSLDSPADHVLRVTMNRPQSANAMNTQMGHDLTAVFEKLSVDTETYRCVILTGAGDKAFCAGGDLKERKGMSDEAWGAQHLVYERMVRALLGCPLPLIGAVNGAAYGGGCEIAAATDFVYASETARFALTEVTLGIIPGAGGTQTLPRAVGQRRAMEIILTGKPFTAADAKEWGLVNHVSAPSELADDALATAVHIAGNAPVSVRQAKQAIRKGMQMSLFDGLSFEIEAYNRTVPTKDRQEGILAFNEKRKAVFRGQ